MGRSIAAIIRCRPTHESQRRRDKSKTVMATSRISRGFQLLGADRIHCALVIGFVAGLTSGAACAEITDSQTPFSMLCVAEQATGFNWKNDNWVRSNYNPENYIINKLNGRDRRCTEDERGEFSRPVVRDESGKDAGSAGCYVLRQMGKKGSSWEPADRCEENWTDRNGQLVLTAIFCKGLWVDYKAHIDGAFILTRTYGVLMSGEQKDSVTLEIGKCSLVENP
jgi:hypothetical protein